MIFAVRFWKIWGNICSIILSDMNSNAKRCAKIIFSYWLVHSIFPHSSIIHMVCKITPPPFKWIHKEVKTKEIGKLFLANICHYMKLSKAKIFWILTKAFWLNLQVIFQNANFYETAKTRGVWKYVNHFWYVSAKPSKTNKIITP